MLRVFYFQTLKNKMGYKHSQMCAWKKKHFQKFENWALLNIFFQNFENFFGFQGHICAYTPFFFCSNFENRMLQKTLIWTFKISKRLLGDSLNPRSILALCSPKMLSGRLMRSYHWGSFEKCTTSNFSNRKITVYPWYFSCIIFLGRK